MKMMKKVIKQTIGLVGVCIAMQGVSVFGTTLNCNLRVKVDNNYFAPIVDWSGEDIWPIVHEGSTYLPMNQLANALGLTIWFDGEMLWQSQRWEKVVDNRTPTYLKRSEEIKVEVFENVKIKGSDRTCKVLKYKEIDYVPARLLSELANMTIDYNQNLEMVLIGDSVVEEEDYKLGIYTITQDQIKQRISELRKKFPDKKYWNNAGVSKEMANSDTVTSTPCKHFNTGMGIIGETCNSYRKGTVNGMQCYGFAMKLSDEIFGENAPLIKHSSFEKAKIGDQVNSNNHSFIIIEKTKDYVKVAECNYGSPCSIKWDRKVYKKSLEGAEYMSRY